MPVFISHRSADNAIALEVYNRLVYYHRITCYLDDLDKEAGNSKNITKHILNRLNSCTHLIAIMTENTKGSWWVPFEIGVARRAPRVISSFTYLYDCDLPEYLKEWPVLRGQSAVDTFACFYKEGKSLLESQRYYSFSTQVQSIDEIHYRMKSELGQR